MQTGRNNPCPCGSGRKFKHCCQSADALQGSSSLDVRRRTREAAAAARDWEVDAVPIMARFSDGRSPRPVLMLVVAGDIIIHHDMHGRLRGEIGDVAEALEAAVSAAAREAGVFPERVRVRHEEAATALAPLLASRDIVVSGGGVPRLDDVAREMVEAVAGAAMWPPVCRPDTWGAWDLPRPLVAELFTAAARFYGLAPWLVMSNLQAPRVELPSGNAWTCCVMGNAGQEYGLVLYSVASDLFDVMGERDPTQPFEGVEGRILSLTFETPADAPDVQREARLNRWTVAGPAAYPMITTINTPGGGVSQSDIRDMISLLDALPAFAAKHGRALTREESTGKPVKTIRWVEPDSGAVFRYAGEAAHYMAEDFDDDAAFADAMPGLPAGMRDDFVATMQRVIAELGPDVREDEMLAAVNRSLLSASNIRNDTPQSDFGGLTPSQVHRLLEHVWDAPSSALRFRHDLTPADVAHSTILQNARILLSFAVEHGPLGATQAGNLKIDVVAALLDRLTLEPEYADGIRRMNKRITEHDVWPLHQVRVVCELAGLLQMRAQRFEPTAAGRALVDPARAGELYALLFHTWFRRFSIAYGNRCEWPELQHQMAYTLYRLRTEASEWRGEEGLLEHVVLPYALEHAPVIEAYGSRLASAVLRTQALDTLTGFALLEQRTTGKDEERQYRVTPLASAFLQFDVMR